MYQQEKNNLAMQVAGAGLLFWSLYLCAGRIPGSGVLGAQEHMHWFDKLFGYACIALGPVLAGFIVGVAVGNRKVYGPCGECGGRFDKDTMVWRFDDRAGHTAHFMCQACRERYEKWNKWRLTQENSFSYRNDEERAWARYLWESDPGYMLEDVFWQGPDGKGFPDAPVNP
jgi:hypothetical protein